MPSSNGRKKVALKQRRHQRRASNRQACVVAQRPQSVGDLVVRHACPSAREELVWLFQKRGELQRLARARRHGEKISGAQRIETIAISSVATKVRCIKAPEFNGECGLALREMIGGGDRAAWDLVNWIKVFKGFGKRCD